METRNAIRISETLKDKSWELFCYHLQWCDPPSFPIVCTRSFHFLLGSMKVLNKFAPILSLALNINEFQGFCHREMVDPDVLYNVLLESFSSIIPYSYSIAADFWDCSITAVLELRILKVFPDNSLQLTVYRTVYVYSTCFCHLTIGENKATSYEMKYFSSIVRVTESLLHSMLLSQWDAISIRLKYKTA